MSATAKNVRRLGFLITALSVCPALYGVGSDDQAQLTRLIGHADYYVREFEKEVALQRGGEKMVWRNQRTALEKVRDLKVKYPDDPNWSFEQIHDYCYERGFTIYPGKISTTNTFRLCALGAIDEADIVDFFKVFREALEKNNVAIPVKYND